MFNGGNLLQSGGDGGSGCHNRPLTQSLLFMGMMMMIDDDDTEESKCRPLK